MSDNHSGNEDKGSTRPSNEAALPGEGEEVSQRGLDAEELAALIDGRLDGAAHSALIARIASSDEDADVLADALGALDDLRGGGVVGIDSARSAIGAKPGAMSLGRWVALAASLAVIAGISLVWAKRRPASAPVVTQYAVSLVARGVNIPAEWNDTPWTASRGSSETLSSDARAARLGARLTDLEIAARSGDTSAVRFALSASALLDEMPVGAPIASMYRGIAGRSGESQSSIDASLDHASAAVRQLPDARMIEIGAWIEAARIAAASRDAEFFRTRESTKLMENIQKSTMDDANAARAVEAVRSGVAEVDPNWSTISSTLTTVLSMFGSDAP